MIQNAIHQQFDAAVDSLDGIIIGSHKRTRKGASPMRTVRPYSTVFCLLLGFLLGGPLAAQQEQINAETKALLLKAMTPGSQHDFLAEQAGT
jgi:hypothetical protein